MFCPEFFELISSHKDLVKKIDKNKDLRQNVANMRSRAVTFLRELLHINWGTAQECRGENACTDNVLLIGNTAIVAYKTGRSKLLAQTNVRAASSNNENLFYYVLTSFMKKRWGFYPRFPLAWDATRSIADNEERNRNWPGAPSSLGNVDKEEPVDDSQPVIDGPQYPVDDYPEWYKPIVEAKFDDPTPEVTETSKNEVTSNGPDLLTGVTCDTSDASPDIQDCFNAFGSLEMAPETHPKQGKKGGGLVGGSKPLYISIKHTLTRSV